MTLLIIVWFLVSLLIVLVGCRTARQREKDLAEIVHPALRAYADKLAKERRIYGRMVNELNSGHCHRAYHHTPQGWRIAYQRPSDVVPFSDLDSQTLEVIRCFSADS